MKLYVSSDAAERKKSLRDQYTQKIHEQENAGKVLIALIYIFILFLEVCHSTMPDI